MSDKLGLYLVHLKISKPGLLGAPVLNLNLTVYAPQGTVNGNAVISQSVTPVEGPVHVPQVTGHIHHTGFGGDQQLVSVAGQYVVSVPPPAIGSYLAHFNAALVVDASWNGKGTFTYGGHTISDAKVEQVER
jgi:hypothetical protein